MTRSAEDSLADDTLAQARSRERYQKHVDRRERARAWGAEKGRMYRSYMTTSITGMEVGVSFAVGALGGMWLDRHFGTAPWLLVAGMALAIGHSIRLLVGISKKMKNDDQANPGDDASLRVESKLSKARPEDDLDRPFNNREDLRGRW